MSRRVRSVSNRSPHAGYVKQIRVGVINKLIDSAVLVAAASTVVDGDFTTAGVMKTDGSGTYSVAAQAAAIADATDAASAITQLNDLLAKLRVQGIIAT